MSNSNQEDPVAKMVDTITLVTSSEQIQGMTEDALEAIDGGAGIPVGTGAVLPDGTTEVSPGHFVPTTQKPNFP
jgi:hypothetical protein